MKTKQFAVSMIGTVLLAALSVPNVAMGQEPASIVGIAKNTDYAKAVRAAVEAAGGLKGIVKAGDTVFIKPNIVAVSPPGAGVVTDYRVVAEVVALAREAGAKRIIIGEHTNPYQTDMGLEASRIGEIKGVEFLDTNTEPSASFKGKAPVSLTGVAFSIPKAWVDADVTISVPVLKTHDIGGVTLSLKNAGIGLPPFDSYATEAGYKVRLHDIGVTKTIADVNQLRKIDFAVIDAMVAGEGPGPIGVKPVRMNTVIAGRDPVAVDSVGAKVMGIEPHLISHIVYSEGVGLGTADPDRIEVKGEPVANVARNLKRAPQNVYPYKMTTYAKGLPKAFAQDGKLDEWAGTHTARINGEWQVTGGSDGWTGVRDLSASFATGYGSGTLVVAGTVSDDGLVEGADGFTLHLSLKNPFEPDRKKSRKKPAAGKDFTVSVKFPKAGAKVEPTASDGRTVDGLSLKRTDSGYAFELVVNLKARGLDLAASEEFWMDLGLTDTDAGTDTATTMHWAGDGNKTADLTTLGRAVFIGK